MLQINTNSGGTARLEGGGVVNRLCFQLVRNVYCQMRLIDDHVFNFKLRLRFLDYDIDKKLYIVVLDDGRTILSLDASDFYSQLKELGGAK